MLAKFDPRPFPPVPDLPLITTAMPNMDEITVPAVKTKADASGLFPATSTPAEFAAFIRKEAQRWSTVVKETGMKYD